MSLYLLDHADKQINKNENEMRKKIMHIVKNNFQKNRKPNKKFKGNMTLRRNKRIHKSKNIVIKQAGSQTLSYNSENRVSII